MHLRVLPFVLGSLFFASTASADETRWYGWQTLAVDAASVAVAAAAANVDTDSRSARPFVTAGLLGGVGGFLVGSPIVHLAHGEYRHAGASLGLHGGGALVSAAFAVGLFSSSCHSRSATSDLSGSECSSVAFVVPLLVGAMITSALDAALLGHERLPSTRGMSVGLAPSRGGATAGITGTF